MAPLRNKYGINGIRCDTCGMEFRDDFTYYSCEGTGYNIDSSKNINSSNGVHQDFDMCESCYDNYTSIIQKNIVGHKRGSIKDDFSKNFYQKTTYLKVNLTKVVVNKDAKNGIASTTEDIDIIIAHDSMKEFLKNILSVRKKAAAKANEEDQWTMK